MNTYRLRLQPGNHYGTVLWGLPTLTSDGLVRSLAGVAVREVSTTPWGQYVIDLRLQRPTHQEALNDICLAIQQLGFTIAEATVTEWVNAAAQGAFVGAFGCGAAGAASQDPAIMFLAAAFGAVAGAVAGSFMRSINVYRVEWSDASGWVLTPVPQESATVLRPRILADLNLLLVLNT